MISRNVLARYNHIKVIVPHCGAYLPLAIPRMKSLTPVMQANKMVGEIDYEANLRTLYYDLAGAHSPEVIRMLLTITTPDHLLYGSDYPYVAPQVLTQSLARMKDYLSKEPDLAPFKEMILWRNAQSLTQSLSTPLHHREGQGGGSLIVRIAEIEVYPAVSGGIPDLCQRSGPPQYRARAWRHLPVSHAECRRLYKDSHP